MALAALVISYVILSKLMKYSSLYIFGTLFSLNIVLTLYLYRTNCVCSLPERWNGAGLMSNLSIALYHVHGCRVVFSNVSTILRLLNIINWEYMLRDSRGGPLMVTAQCRYSSTLVHIPKRNSWGGYYSVFSPGWTAMIGCRKKLGNPGWSLETPGGYS